MEKAAQLPNPLLALHHRDQAEMQPYGALEIVSTFGEPQAEYSALHKSCGLMDLPFRGVLEITGKDRHQFLNGLISNRIWDKNTKQPMPAGSWVYAFLLNLKGRIVADMAVVDTGDATLIELDARLVDDILAVFDKYLFAEQVKMRSLIGQTQVVALFGPQSAHLLQQAANHDGEFAPGHSALRVNIANVECIAYRDNPTGADGFHLFVPTASVEAIWSNLLGSFGDNGTVGKRLLRPVGWAAFNSCRIEAGRALFGIDFGGVPAATAYPVKKLREEAESEESGPGVLPAETGTLFNRAVDLSKCYIGQEVVARMHARHVFARQIVGFRMGDDALPLAGATIHDSAGNHIGVVTSSTVSPMLSNAAIGLAFVKKPHFAIGSKLVIPAEGRLREGTVVELPFLPG